MLYNVSLLLVYLYTKVGNSQCPTLSFSLTSSLTLSLTPGMFSISQMKNRPMILIGG